MPWKRTFIPRYHCPILSSSDHEMAKNQVKSTRIRLGRRAECPLFSPKRLFTNGDLDSVRMSAFGQKRTFPFSSEAASYFSLTRAHKTLGSRCRTSFERLSRCLRSARQRRKPLKSCCRTMIARVTSKPLLLRIMQSPFPRHPVSPQGFGAVWTRA